MCQTACAVRVAAVLSEHPTCRPVFLSAAVWMALNESAVCYCTPVFREHGGGGRVGVLTINPISLNLLAVDAV